MTENVYEKKNLEDISLFNWAIFAKKLFLSPNLLSFKVLFKYFFRAPKNPDYRYSEYPRQIWISDLRYETFKIWDPKIFKAPQLFKVKIFCKI